MMPILEKRKSDYLENFKSKMELALKIEEQCIGILCADWAGWQSMLHYVEHPDKVFEEYHFPEKIFVDDKLDFVLVLDNHKNIIFFKCYWQDREYVNYQDLKINRSIDKIIAAINQTPEQTKGIINSAYEPLLIVANSIRPNEGTDVRSGTLIIGKFIDKRMLKRLSRYLPDNSHVLSFTKITDESFFSDHSKGKDKNYFFQEDSAHISTYLPLRDTGGRPVLALKGMLKSAEFQILTRHAISFSTVIVFSTILLGLILFYFIDHHLIKRLRVISGTMSRIEGLKDLSIRVENSKYQDEINSLVIDLNATLDKLENEKKNREKAEQAKITQGKLASLGRLSSNIAHEINNPLLAISNSFQVIKNSIKRKSALQKEAIEITESEIDRIRKIITGLLDFHRSEKEFSRINLKEVVLQTIDVIKWSHKLKSTKLVYKMDDECYVYGSRVKLEEVFMNFILNAVEAMEDKPGKLKIKVCHASRKNFVEIHFIDNGPGLPPEVRESLFEPFISTKHGKGVGLGLYISYKIISLHQGEILWEDDYKKGTHFIIRFPEMKRSING